MTRVDARFVCTVAALAVVMAGCAKAPPQRAAEDPREELATQPEVVTKAVEDLANRLQIPAEEIEVRSFEAVTWPDSSLGCPEEGMMYAQVLTEGSKVDLAVEDHIYSYHAAEGREPFLCGSDEGDSGGPTLEQLGNAAYQGIYDRAVRLSAGRFEGEPFEPGAASRPTLVLIPEPLTYADLDGDGSEEAIVLLAENSGGSGTFVYLAVVALVGGEPQNVATALIGDRARVVSLEADGERIRARLSAGGPPGAPETPTDEIVREWELEGGALTERRIG